MFMHMYCHQCFE